VCAYYIDDVDVNFGVFAENSNAITHQEAGICVISESRSNFLSQLKSNIIIDADVQDSIKTSFGDFDEVKKSEVKKRSKKTK